MSWSQTACVSHTLNHHGRIVILQAVPQLILQCRGVGAVGSNLLIYVYKYNLLKTIYW